MPERSDKSERVIKLPLAFRAATADARRTDQLAKRAWQLDRRQRLRAGRRYSAFVDLMKLVLPAIALVLVGALILYSALYKPPGEITFTFSDLKAVGRSLEMTKPTLTYTDRQQRAFVVKAKTATELPGGTSHWRLNTIHATMQPPGEALVTLTSRTGLLDSEGQKLDLEGDIVVTTEDGRRFEARTAHVDFEKGAVTSEEPVRASSNTGNIESDRFELRNSGKQVTFVGHVRFRSTPKKSS